MNAKRKTVCFVAKNNFKIDSCKNELDDRIRDLIEKEGAVIFLSDMSLEGGIDFAETVLKMKTFYKNIRLECVLPYETQAELWSEDMRNKYFDIIEKSDKEILLQTHFTEDCLLKCREFMIEKSDYILEI